MHRVLSFQMARGFGATSEYVTKRMCFSLVLSVAFLCILGGFVLGRYAVERTLKMRADKAYLELADNGLKISNHLQVLLLQILEQASFDDNYAATDTLQTDEVSIHGIKGFFKTLTMFGEIIETKSCTIATKRGFREPDRYVVFSGSGDGIGLAIELAKALDRIYMDQSWKPRRSIVFCMFLGSTDFCKNELPSYVQSNVIGYIAVHGNAIQEKGTFVVSGSDMMQQLIYQSIIRIRFTTVTLDQLINNLTMFSEEYHLPRLAMKMPHAVLSFTKDQSKSLMKANENISLEKYRRVLTQIVGISIWRLSESVLLRWDPGYFNYTISKALNSIDNKKFGGLKERLVSTLQKTVNEIREFSEKLDELDKTKCLEVRMANDLSLKVDEALLCLDKDLHSKTDVVIFSMLPHESDDVVSTHLIELEACYRKAGEILHKSQSRE